MKGKIMQINKKTLPAIQAEMLEALKPVLAKHGLEVNIAGGTFAELEATLKFCIMGKSDNGLTQVELDYDKYKEMFKLPARGTKFHSRLKEYTVFGFNVKSRGRAVICTSTSDGKQYLFDSEDVKRAATVTTKEVEKKTDFSILDALTDPPMTLKIKGHTPSMVVADFAAASAAYAKARDESGEGASTFPEGELTRAGKKIARISYNAYIWHPVPYQPEHEPLYPSKEARLEGKAIFSGKVVRS